MDERDAVLIHAVAVLTPFILVFGFYVIIHGHLSPGGGFAGGTIIAAALILNAIAFKGRYRSVDTNRLLKYISISLIIYSLIKVLGTFFSEELYAVIPKGVPGRLLSGGFIVPLNIAIGIVVACVMFLFYTGIGGGGR